MQERITEILKGFGIAQTAVTNDVHFVRDLGMDSLDTVDLIMQLEKEFGIRIPDEDYPRLATMNGVMAYLRYEQQIAEPA